MEAPRRRLRNPLLIQVVGNPSIPSPFSPQFKNTLNHFNFFLWAWGQNNTLVLDNLPFSVFQDALPGCHPWPRAPGPSRRGQSCQSNSHLLLWTSYPVLPTWASPHCTLWPPSIPGQPESRWQPAGLSDSVRPENGRTSQTSVPPAAHLHSARAQHSRCGRPRKNL